MATRIPDSLDRLSQADLIGVVRELIGEVGRLRAENEKLGVALTQLKAEHQAVKDELARLKKLPPRPPQKPSGMDKATDRGGSGGGDTSAAGEKSSRQRGSQLDKLTIGATVVVRVAAPPGNCALRSTGRSPLLSSRRRKCGEGTRQALLGQLKGHEIPGKHGLAPGAHRGLRAAHRAPVRSPTDAG